MNTIQETFKKSERLCSVKKISALFEEGNIFYTSSFKVVWLKNEVQGIYPAQITFSVSKRSFKHSVTRNLIKRRFREAYRKNKHILYSFLEKEELQIIFIVIYRGISVPDYQSLEKSVAEMISKLILMTDPNSKKC
jgi:ribonuclease P protein component